MNIAPSDYPSGKKGDVLTVEFTVAGVHCVGLNGGPEFKHSASIVVLVIDSVRTRPVSRAAVQLWYAGGGMGGDTDSSGAMRFDDRPAGRASLRLRKAGTQERRWMYVVTLRDSFRDTVIVDVASSCTRVSPLR